MKIDIITLFPDMFKGPFDMSMIWKAKEKGLVKIELHDLRQWGLGARRTVDDTTYGGGDGMVLKPEPVVAAIEAVGQETTNKKQGRKQDTRYKIQDTRVIVLSPQGKKFDQQRAVELSKLDHLILIAGHYEGFDERIMEYASEELSIGDYVLTGGELPAMVVVDAVVRLLPGVLGGEQSAHVESFSDGLLEYPQYTRPVDFRGSKVPEVLQNGHHAEIEKWRLEQAKQKTQRNRPDLLEG